MDQRRDSFRYVEEHALRRLPITLFYPLILANPPDLRHTCEHDEGMAGYGWTAYDVQKGGMQIVNDTDNRVDLITQFVKVSGDERHPKGECT